MMVVPISLSIPILYSLDGYHIFIIAIIIIPSYWVHSKSTFAIKFEKAKPVYLLNHRFPCHCIHHERNHQN